MEYIIERIEDGIASLEENGKIINIKADTLPKNAVEGDVLIFESGQYRINKEKTNELRKENISLLNKLKSKHDKE